MLAEYVRSKWPLGHLVAHGGVFVDIVAYSFLVLVRHNECKIAFIMSPNERVPQHEEHRGIGPLFS